MRVIYLPSAKKDLIWFYEYYISVFPEGANKAIKQLDTMADLLATNPYIGQKIQREARQLVISSTPFSYIYRVTDEYIEVIRVWDNRQDSLD